MTQSLMNWHVASHAQSLHPYALDESSLSIGRVFSKYFFSREPTWVFKTYIQVLSIETSTSLGSLQKFESIAGELKVIIGAQLQLTLSPDLRPNSLYSMQQTSPSIYGICEGAAEFWEAGTP